MRKIAIVLIASLFTALSVYAQVDRGNGGDETSRDDRTAWLVGEAGASFGYCLQRSTEFNITDEQFARRLNRALNEWRSHFNAARVLEEDEPNPRRWYPLVSAKQVPCDGREHLTFYLGATNELVDIVKKQYRNPTAFHFRLKHADHQGTGKGLIWLTKPNSIQNLAGQTCANGVCRDRRFPNWLENDELLDMFLIHELGHAYGIPHIDGTIMAENLVEFVRFFGKERRHINWSRELLSNFQKGMAVLYPARSEMFGTRFRRPDGTLNGFAFLLTRDSHDNKKFHGSLAQPDLRVGLDPLQRIQGGVLPDLLKFEFSLESGFIREHIVSTQDILCIPQRYEGVSGRCYKNFGWSIPVTVTDEFGKTMPGIFEYNLNRSVHQGRGADLAHPYHLRVYQDGRWMSAFEARFM